MKGEKVVKMLFDKIQVHVSYKKDGLTVYFFDSYGKAFEFVNSIVPANVKEVKIIFPE